MQLTGKQIVERGIVTGFSEAGIQQQGVDVRLRDVVSFTPQGIGGTPGVVPAVGKTILRDRKSIPINLDRGPEGAWYLEPGYYEVIVEEGCKMPDNAAMVFISRSSMVRNGAIIHCGQFDAGFETEHMGFFMQVLFPIIIEKGARIAQTRVFETESVSNLYQGQWQNDKQRQRKES